MAMNPNMFSGWLHAAETLDGPPEGNRWTMWVRGVCVPIAVVVGAVVVFLQTAAIPTSLVIFFLGVFLHFHYFWGLHPKLAGMSAYFKNCAALGVIVSFFYGFFRYFATM
jgi:hypothetical protein